MDFATKPTDEQINEARKVLIPVEAKIAEMVSMLCQDYTADQSITGQTLALAQAIARSPNVDETFDRVVEALNKMTSLFQKVEQIRVSVDTAATYAAEKEQA